VTDGHSVSASQLFTVITPSISLSYSSQSVNSAAVGYTITVSGSGFAASDTGACTSFTAKDSIGTVYSAAPFVAGACTFTTTVNPTGSTVSATFYFASGILPPYNPFTITILGAASANDFGSTTFTVLSPSLQLTPNAGLQGSSISYSATNFALGDVGSGCTSIAFSVGPTTMTNTCPNFATIVQGFSVYSGTSGTFTVADLSVVLPPPSSGTMTLTAAGAPGDSASSSFTVLVPTLALNPNTGITAGVSISISGAGYASTDATCTLSYAPVGSSIFTSIPTQICISAGSTISGSFTVESSWFSSSTSSYTIEVISHPSLDFATAIITPGATLPLLPSIILSPNSGVIGTGVTITGSGFNPADAGNPCTVTSIPLPDIVSSSPAATCSISASGKVTASFTVVNTAALGAHTIKVIGSTGDLALATFTVTTVTPRITITPAAGPSNIIVGVTASGFSSSDTILTFLVSPNTLSMSTTSCAISPANSGGCTFTATMISSVPQGYTISAIGNVAGDTAPATFILSSTPSSISVSPTSGPSGTLISVSGTIPVAPHGSPSTGYTSCTIGGGSGSGISISTSSCQIISFTSGSPAYSTFAGSFIVGNQAPGTYSVRVTASGASAPSGYANYVQATFILTGPKISLNPSTGGRGLSVAITGSGFSFADNTCSMSSSNGNLILNNACTINGGTGAASGGFVVGSLNPGTYSVRLTGNTGDFAEATFTVMAGPSITLTPSSGAVGTTVSVTGSGFFLTDSSCSISGTGVSAQACSVNLSSGAPSGSFLVGNVVAGSYTVTLSANGGDFAQAVFVVTSVTPGLTLYPSGPVTPGTTVTFTATGLLTPDTGCSLQATPSTIILSSPTCRISSAGVATGSFVVSYLATADRNPWTIQVVGSPGGDVVSGSLSIIPVIGVTPSSGTSGTQFAFTGYGFSLTATTCTVLPSPGSWSALNCGVTSNGQVSGSFVSGANTAGVYAVTVRDSTGLTAIGFATIGSPTASIFIVPNAAPPTQLGVAVVGSGFNPTDTACAITSGAGLFSGTPSCSVSGGFVAGSFNVAGSASPGYYVITATGSPYGDFALNILYVTPSGATTVTSTSSSTSIISTGYTTVTSTTPVTLTTTTFTWTGVSTETDYTLTTTTFTGLSTTAEVSTTFTTSIVSSVSTIITSTTTTYIATIGAIVAPAFSSGSSRAVDGAALGLLSVITLLGWVLFRRLAF
jgi:hypothetical protein